MNYVLVLANDKEWRMLFREYSFSKSYLISPYLCSGPFFHHFKHHAINMKALLLSASILFGGATYSQIIYTTSGTFVVPDGVTSIQVELVGAGGNGYSNGGGGGGGGGYAAGTFTVTPGTSYSITVGDGGSGMATAFGASGIQAGAGSDGAQAANPNVGGGGAGGTGLGGDLNMTGGAGGGGYYTYFGGGGGGAAGSTSNGGVGGNTITWTGICLTPGGAAGASGGAPGGAGGKGAGFVDASCSAADPAGNGGNYGGGGGGGNGNSSGPGIGGGGYCSITWDISTGVSYASALTTPMVLNNPFTQHIVVSHVVGDERLLLMDALGRQLWSGVHIEQQDFSALHPGTYILRMGEGDSVRTFKVMKQ